MFSGIVEDLGRVEAVGRGPGGLALEILAGRTFADVALGASVCVSGACLTVVANGAGRLRFDVVDETVRRTRFGAVSAGDRVNLERSLPASGRIEGHFVLGHVDAVVPVASVRREPSDFLLSVRVPPDLRAFVAEKGSIALDGVSLTVASFESGVATVALIPTTRERTTLGAAHEGSTLHLEVDVLARYVAARLRG
jgi:riboflavin synthase